MKKSSAASEDRRRARVAAPPPSRPRARRARRPRRRRRGQVREQRTHGGRHLTARAVPARKAPRRRQRGPTPGPGSARTRARLPGWPAASGSDCQFGSELGDQLFVGVVAAEAGGRVALGQLAEVVARDQTRRAARAGAYSCGVSLRPPRPAGAGRAAPACAGTGGRWRRGAAPSRSAARVTSCASRTARARRRRKRRAASSSAASRHAAGGDREDARARRVRGAAAPGGGPRGARARSWRPRS